MNPNSFSEGLEKGFNIKNKLIKVVLVFLVILWLFFSTVIIITAGNQAVITRFGAITGKTLNPGMHLIIPFVDNVHIFDVREQKEQVDAGSASRDLQSVDVKIALNYHLDSSRVNQLYQEVGEQYKERIIDPAIQESIKASTANYTAEELITKRAEVKEVTKKILAERLLQKYIILDELSIVNFSFSKEFDAAIELKQTAEQSALKAKNDLDRIKVEAQQKIEQAKAEAESLRLQRENISGDLIKLREIEAQIKYIDKWNGQLPTYMGAGNPIISIGK
jgi:regulator of protease activity HflC (stomatin/prohibitin superfamily)